MAGGTHDESTAFDLTALLDILSNIIFFLMASFGASVVAMVPVTVPTLSEDGENDTAAKDDEVTMTMALSRDGSVKLSAANNELQPDVLTPFAKTIPGKSGRVDAQAINDHLWTVKEAFRKSKDLVVVPEGAVTYEMLVEAMDAARERKMEVDGEKVFPSLFPAVVVSSRAE